MAQEREREGGETFQDQIFMQRSGAFLPERRFNYSRQAIYPRALLYPGLFVYTISSREYGLEAGFHSLSQWPE